MQICRKKYLMKKEKNKINDIKNIAEVNKLRKSILNLKFQKATGQLEKTSEIKKTRRKIAVLLTNISKNKEIKNA